MIVLAHRRIPSSTLVPMPTDAPELIDSIGTEEFGTTLVKYLRQLCGADHCAAFKLGPPSLGGVAASSFDPVHGAAAQVKLYLNNQLWRNDPAIHQAQQALFDPASRIIHMDLSAADCMDLRPTAFPQLRDRLLLCGWRKDMAFGLSVVRSNPHAEFAVGAVERLAASSGMLISLLAKHDQAVAGRSNPAHALTCLESIEDCLCAMTELPRREGEVCSRVLYGMSTTGIALDLDVGEESVKTYRRRAYQRLQIGSERELLNWYLSLWSQWRSRLPQASRRSMADLAHH